jgi:hypothetical protein
MPRRSLHDYDHSDSDDVSRHSPGSQMEGQVEAPPTPDEAAVREACARWTEQQGWDVMGRECPCSLPDFKVQSPTKNATQQIPSTTFQGPEPNDVAADAAVDVRASHHSPSRDARSSCHSHMLPLLRCFGLVPVSGGYFSFLLTF